ncbi:MAG: transglycosylase SLT domain-containing protein [Bdellovibrionales bacterium]
MIKKSLKWTVICGLLLSFNSHASSFYEEFAPPIRNKEHSKAIELLLKQKEDLSERNPQEQAGILYALGKSYLENGQTELALENLELGLKSPEMLEDYFYFQIGKAHFDKKENGESEKWMKKVVAFKPRSHLHLHARWYLAKIAIDKKHYRTARKILRYLERKRRGNELYPEILNQLVRVELKRNNYWQACRWTKKLYRKYPMHPVTADWPFDLASVSFNKIKPKCKASQKDRVARMKNLLWNGQNDLVIARLKKLEKSKVVEPYDMDVMWIRFHLHIGEPAPALDILKKHYSKKKMNFDYLKLLARAAEKNSQYPLAVGLYHKAYKLNPRKRDGRWSLFRSGFLSYQFQDYDGAATKFAELIKKYPRSGLARDAKWHMAWVKYLKADYVGATKDLKAMWRDRRRLRRSRSISEDKIMYWLAMSQMKAGETNQARVNFSKLAGRKSYSYYAISARARLLSIFGQEEGRTPASLNFKNFDKTMALLSDETEDTPENPRIEDIEDEVSVLGDEAKAMESEEIAQAKADEDEEKRRKAEQAKIANLFSKAGSFGFQAADEVDSDDFDEIIQVTDFKNEIMNKRFKRAMELIQLGFYDDALWELYDIERRTRNRTYLRVLMGAYEGIGAYHRSSYIGAIYFSGERYREGIDGTKYLWSYTYPQAYPDKVENYSDKFGVPQEFIWAIMRAESHFRRRVKSPVGAQGLMQLMPYTAEKVAKLLKEDFDVSRLMTPDKNVRYGSRYLKRLMKKFDSKFPLVAAGYNAGPHRVDKWLYNFGHRDMDEFIEHIPFLETRLYVKKVTRNFHIYELLRESRSLEMDVTSLAQPVGVRVIGNYSQKENWDQLQ